MINGISPDQDWRRNFRMTWEKYLLLCKMLRPYLSPGNTPNYRFLSVEKKICITLYYLKDTGSFWMKANTFGIHQCIRSNGKSAEDIKISMVTCLSIFSIV